MGGVGENRGFFLANRDVGNSHWGLRQARDTPGGCPDTRAGLVWLRVGAMDLHAVSILRGGRKGMHAKMPAAHGVASSWRQSASLRARWQLARKP